MTLPLCVLRIVTLIFALTQRQAILEEPYVQHLLCLKRFQSIYFVMASLYTTAIYAHHSGRHSNQMHCFSSLVRKRSSAFIDFIPGLE